MPSLLEILVRPLGVALRGRRAGDAASISCAPELATDREMTLTSASYPADGAIPLRHSGIGRGDNISPELSWGGAPADTAQYLLIMEDPDVPLLQPIVHYAAFFGSTITHVAEGALTADNPAVRNIPGMGGRVGYHGPRPMPGHGPHRYVFYLYALDQAIPADQPLPNLAAVLPLVKGHVLARGSLAGVQER